MADVPRDPRQLARDILAGKISIEELAREQQRRRAGGAGMPQARLPDRVPLPRTLPAQQRPVIRQASPRLTVPASQQQRTLQVPQQRPAPQQQRPVPQRPRAVITAPSVPPRRQEARPASMPASMEMPSGVQRPAESPASIAGRESKVDRSLNIHGLAASRTALRQGILLAEILGKPVAMRGE